MREGVLAIELKKECTKRLRFHEFEGSFDTKMSSSRFSLGLFCF